MTHEDALSALISVFGHRGLGNYGYKVCYRRRRPSTSGSPSATTRTVTLRTSRPAQPFTRPSGSYVDAAWLRPGVRTMQQQVSAMAKASVLTEYGRRWLAANADGQILPLQRRRFVGLLELYGTGSAAVS